MESGIRVCSVRKALQLRLPVPVVRDAPAGVVFLRLVDERVLRPEKLERYVYRRARRRAEEPAHKAILGGYLTVMVPVMPSSRCPVTVQTSAYLPGATSTLSFS